MTSSTSSTFAYLRRCDSRIASGLPPFSARNKLMSSIVESNNQLYQGLRCSGDVYSYCSTLLSPLKEVLCHRTFSKCRTTSACKFSVVSTSSERALGIGGCNMRNLLTGFDTIQFSRLDLCKKVMRWEWKSEDGC